MRLALYAHFSRSGDLALHVLFYLRKLRDLGFQICIVSNSPIPQTRERELREVCEKVILRENTGYDFAMWQRALEEYDLNLFDELLLTNSSIIGPLRPLAPMWQKAGMSQCDFWGLTENKELGHHLQSYFILFRRQVLEHPCFREFWRSVLPLNDIESLLQRYEAGLTFWFEQNGFKWSALFPQEQIHAILLSRFSVVEKLRNRIFPVDLPQNTTMLLPDLLLECGMPFLKAKLLYGGANERWQVGPNFAMHLLESSDIPPDVLNELRATVKLF